MLRSILQQSAAGTSDGAPQHLTWHIGDDPVEIIEGSVLEHCPRNGEGQDNTQVLGKGDEGGSIRRPCSRDFGLSHRETCLDEGAGAHPDKHREAVDRGVAGLDIDGAYVSVISNFSS